MLKAFINPQSALNNTSLNVNKDKLNQINSRNQTGLKQSLSEGITELNKIQTSASQPNTIQTIKNPGAFQSFSTDRLAAKISKVKGQGEKLKNDLPDGVIASSGPQTLYNLSLIKPINQKMAVKNNVNSLIKKVKEEPHILTKAIGSFKNTLSQYTAQVKKKEEDKPETEP